MSKMTTTWRQRVAERGRPIFGAKLQGWRHKIFRIFPSLQSDVAFEVKKSFFVII